MKVRKRKKPEEKLLPELPGSIGDFFRRLEIAEAAIGENFSTRASEPPGIFMRCKIPAILEGLSLEVYRSHVREVVETEAMTGAPLCGMSDAEILGLIYARSLRGPILSASSSRRSSPGRRSRWRRALVG